MADGKAKGVMFADPQLDFAVFTPMTFAQLTGLCPAVTANAGARAVVSDATLAYSSANIAGAIAGGGANTVPAFNNGAAWVVG